MFCHRLIVMLLTLAVQVPNAGERQQHRGHWLYAHLFACSGFFSLVQWLPQIRQFVEVGLLGPTEIGWRPRWSAGGALTGSLPLHDPFCQVRIFLIWVEDRVVGVIVILFLRSGGSGQHECLTHGHLQRCRGRRAVQLEEPYCVGGFRVGTHAVITVLVLFRLQSLPMEIEIDDFSHVGGKYSEIPRDNRCSDRDTTWITTQRSKSSD